MRGREAAGTPPSVSGLPNHPGQESKSPRRKSERPGTQERTAPSLRSSTAVNSCVAMCRGHSSMKGCGFSFYFIFYISISMGFPLSFVQ